MIYASKLKHIIDSKGYTLTQINQQLNIKNNTHTSLQDLSQKINAESLRVTELLQILDLLDYELQMVPTTTQNSNTTLNINKAFAHEVADELCFFDFSRFQSRNQ